MAIRNFVIGFLDGVRDFFEHASPSVFAVIAAILPYMSPFPIAILTAKSAETFLKMDSTTAGILVFVLEGITIWTTAVFVDSVVELIRSRNAKSVIMVLILFVVIVAYIVILINLNVKLKSSVENISSEYETVITLICFLPLISGFMNGYWKVAVETKKKKIDDESYRRKQDELDRDRKSRDAITKYKIKHGIDPDAVPNTPAPAAYQSDAKRSGSIKQRFASDYRDEIIAYIESVYSKSGTVLRVIDITTKFKLDYDRSKGYVSGIRSAWMKQNGIE